MKVITIGKAESGRALYGVGKVEEVENPDLQQLRGIWLMKILGLGSLFFFFFLRFCLFL